MLADSQIEVYSIEELEEAINRELWKQGPVLYRFPNGDAEEEFDNFASVLCPAGFPLGGFAIIVDEASDLQTSNSIHPRLNQIIKQHPESGEGAITVIQNTHTPADWARGGKAQTDHWFIFRVTDLSSIKQIRDMMGEEVAQIVPKLPLHHCLHYTYARTKGTQQWEIWNHPQAWGPIPDGKSPVQGSRATASGDEHSQASAEASANDETSTPDTITARDNIKRGNFAWIN